MQGTRCVLFGAQRVGDEFAETRLNLLHASRLAHAGMLLTSILHEMYQPLAAVLLRARNGRDLLDAGEHATEGVRVVFDDIESSVAFAVGIIDRLQTLSRKRPLERRPLDVNQPILDIADLAEVHAKAAGVVLRREFGNDLPQVNVDRVSIQHAVLILIINAIEATRDEDERLVTVQTRPAADSVEIRVTDTGPGVVEDHRDRLFEPFFTTKDEGTGLGLAIARSIIEAQDGTLVVESRPGPGACFYISLPPSQPARHYGSRAAPVAQ